ncbi:C40 family peptidase [Motilibacter aurantiacus]|uniref:C40 family peptidase n=1 Tax=Motilibacter aurantiacus TaxID=2714955 RepID=UPI0014074228|nr:hypothetical protein [Motilibacter aurantiacus]
MPAVAVATLAAPLATSASAATAPKAAAKETKAVSGRAAAAKLLVNAPTKTPVVMAHPTVGKSTRGGSVLWVQRRLGVKPSGVYGTATVRAVKRLQAVAGLKQTGIVDAKTWSALGVPYRKPKASRTASLLKPGTVGFGNLVLAEARKYAGAPYRYGGMSPRGFDCSGLVSYVFGKLGVSLPHSSGAIKQRVTKISRSAVRPGDLVFVSKGGRTSHVAIYAGGGYWFEASNPSRPVGKNKAWSSSVSYGRVA